MISVMTSPMVRQDTQIHKVRTQLNFLLFNVFKCSMKHKISISCLGWVHKSRYSDKMSKSSWLDSKRLELVLFIYFVSTKTEQMRKEDTRKYFSLFFILVISHPLPPYVLLIPYPSFFVVRGVRAQRQIFLSWSRLLIYHDQGTS